MSKYNFKKFGFCLLLITLVLVLVPDDAEAKKGESGGDSCLSYISVSWDPSDPANDIEDKANLKVSATKGTWKVYANHLDIDNPGELFSSRKGTLIKTITDNWTTVTPSSSYSKDIQITSSGKYVVMFVKLASEIKNDKGEVICNPGYFYLNDSGNIKITSDNGNESTIGKGTGKWRNFKFSGYSGKLPSGTNSNKPECLAMYNGKYYTDQRDSDKNVTGDLGDFRNKMKAYFPYCWGDADSSNIEFSKKTINAARKNFIEYYNTRKDLKFSSQTQIDSYRNDKQSLIDDASWHRKTVSGNEEQDWSTDASTLNCDKEDKEETTKKYWTEKEVVSNDYCSVKCTEKFTVTYTPPVASKAGLCFSYKVTVKSIVNCITEKKNDMPWPQNKVSTCDYAAVCEDDSDQAGPSEEFDNCIKKCDNGKYSQSCINKCYNKVYGKKKKSTKSNVKKASNITKTNKIEFMDSNKKDPYKYYEYEDGKYFNLEDNCSTQSKLTANLDMCAKGFKEAKDTSTLGTYTKEGKKYIWTPDNSVKDDHTGKFAGTSRSSGSNSVVNSMKRAAPYYLRTISETKDLLKSLFGIGTGKNGFPGPGSPHRYYNIDKNGVKRQVAENWSCPETCWFKQSKNSSDDCVSTDKEAYELYNNEISLKKKQIEDCKTASAELCSTTESTFNISVTNEREKDGIIRNGSFTGKNKSGNNDDILCSSDNRMFIKLPEDNKTPAKCDNGINGKCYGTDYPNHHYKTTITFPGSCIDKKQLKTDFMQNGECDTSYEPRPDKFCSAFDSVDVNYKWSAWHDEFKYEEGEKKGQLIYPDVQEPEIKDNIRAYVGYDIDENGTEKLSDTGFGKFNWHLKFYCFYGITNSTGTPPPETPNCKDPEYKKAHPEKCPGDETTPTSYKFKVIKANTLFTSGSNQKQGYNWTSDATIKSGVNNTPDAQTYTIDPQKYVEYIRKNESNEVIYDTRSNDDYRIFIPSDGIDYIKSIYKNEIYDYKLDGLRPDPNIEGLERYYSDFLDHIRGQKGIEVSFGNNVRPSGGTGTNNNYDNISALK